MAQLAMLVVGVASSLNKGVQTNKVAYGQAEAIRDSKNRNMAATTANISERQREKENMYSRALAVSAASGAGVDDPGIVNLLGDLNAEGEYRILAELYTGSSEAEGLRNDSLMAMRAGDAAQQASYMEAATTVLSAYGSGNNMFGKFSQSAQMNKGLSLAKPTGNGIRSYPEFNPQVRYG